MELFLCDISVDTVLSEEHRVRRDTLAKKVSHFRREKEVTPPFNTCSSCLSRSYVEQVSNVAWPKVKYCRQRSHSYPLIKRLNPLPRLTEEDETAEVERPTVKHTRVPQVQTLNWTDNKLSHEWLYKINTLRSTLTSLELPSRAKGTHCLTKPLEAKGTSGEKRVGFETSQQNSPTACRHESTSIERLWRAVEDVHQDRLCIKKEPVSKTSQVRKPDSTYISLISGFTQDTHVQSSASDDDTNKHINDTRSKKEKNCKNLKCIQMSMFAPRKLFCSTSRNIQRQMSKSSEYIQQIGSLGC